MIKIYTIFIQLQIIIIEIGNNMTTIQNIIKIENIIELFINFNIENLLSNIFSN